MNLAGLFNELVLVGLISLLILIKEWKLWVWLCRTNVVLSHAQDNVLHELSVY